MVHRWKQRGWGAPKQWRVVKGQVWLYKDFRSICTGCFSRKKNLPQNHPTVCCLPLSYCRDQRLCDARGNNRAMFVSMHHSKLMEFVQELGMFEQCFNPSRESRPHPHWTSRATNDTFSAMRGLRGFPMQNSGGADNLDKSIKLLVMQFLLMQT